MSYQKRKFVLWPDRPSIRGSAVAALEDSPKDEPIEVILRPYKKSKSEEQLGYLWGVVLPAIRDKVIDGGQRCTSDDIYQWMIEKYASSKPFTFEGETSIVRNSASHMKVDEMSNFIDCIIQHAAQSEELGYLPVPPADPYYGDEGREEASKRGS